jgi:hypothetical protein
LCFIPFTTFSYTFLYLIIICSILYVNGLTWLWKVIDRFFWILGDNCIVLNHSPWCMHSRFLWINMVSIVHLNAIDHLKIFYYKFIHVFWIKWTTLFMQAHLIFKWSVIWYIEICMSRTCFYLFECYRPPKNFLLQIHFNFFSSFFFKYIYELWQ